MTRVDQDEFDECFIAMLAEAYLAGRLEEAGDAYVAPDQHFAELLTRARAEALRTLGEETVAGLAVAA